MKKLIISLLSIIVIISGCVHEEQPEEPPVVDKESEILSDNNQEDETNNDKNDGSLNLQENCYHILKYPNQITESNSAIITPFSNIFIGDDGKLKMLIEIYKPSINQFWGLPCRFVMIDLH